MSRHFPQFLIAAPSSASGKTTVSLAIMAALTRRGMCVQPFKCGPDYIDTKFHEFVCHRSSVNLDSFMSSPAHIRSLYDHYTRDADACVVEGMMGFMDGYNRDAGSSAEIASILQLPVVLVVDARSAAYSVAPLLWGMKHYREGVNIIGVIFNKVGSPRHRAALNQVCEDVGIPCIGCVYRDPALEQSSRYLGLDFSRMSQRLKQVDVSHIDLDLLLALADRPPVQATNGLFDNTAYDAGRHFVIARNEESFSFIYAQHVDLLRHMGRVSFFDPEQDEPLPADTTCLYLPGGYPEKHLNILGRAQTALNAIRSYVASGGRVLAECGGMMYLSRGIYTDGEPSFVPLVGALPFAISSRKASRKLHLGYRSFEYRGVLLKGHEFHYTDFADDDRPASLVEMHDASGNIVDTPLFRSQGVLASYTHLYWGETPELLTGELFV